MNVKDQLIFKKLDGFIVEELKNKEILKKEPVYKYICNRSITFVGSAMCTEENGIYKELNPPLFIDAGDILEVAWSKNYILEKECWIVYK